MPSLDERLTDHFLRWAFRGRGLELWDASVSPEPAFVPYRLPPPQAIVDDGRKQTILSSFWRSLADGLAGETQTPEAEKTDETPEPRAFTRRGIVEVAVNVGGALRTGDYRYFLPGLAACEDPLAFELVATEAGVTAQFAASPHDVPILLRQLNAFFPECSAHEVEGVLAGAWDATDGDEFASVEVGLMSEFMLPLAAVKDDALAGIVAALGDVGAGEFALFQVIFEPVRHPWADSVIRSVCRASGEAFFINVPELSSGARQKVASPLYAAVVRLAVRAETRRRTEEVFSGVRAALGIFENRDGNGLIIPPNDAYPLEAQVEDLLLRQSRRSGMILNADELIAFVHIPSDAVRSPRLLRQTKRTKAAPESAKEDSGLYLGENVHAGVQASVFLAPEERTRHMHVVGASGTGKSTFLFNLIRQDVEKGRGVAVLDPHGDLIDKVLSVIPEERVADVVLLDPSDLEWPVGFNILRAHSELEKTLLASDLVSVFERLSTSWGDQMGSVLRQAVLAFLESDRGGSLLDLRRFLLEPAFREEFLQSVRDSEVVYYWRKAFPQLAGTKSIGPILTRLETFLSPKSIRYMVGQRENRLDFARILDGGKILLAKLAQGTIGRENSYLLGALLVAKIHETAMARQAQEESDRRDFAVFIDEFPNFITPSLAEILSGARKYRISLVLAHQEMRQLERDKEVAGAVLANAYTRVCFRLGEHDAKALEGGFSCFEAKDFLNLGTGEAICRLGRSDWDFNIAVPNPSYPDEEEAKARRDAVVRASREAYGTPRDEVEAQLAVVSVPKESPAAPAATSLPPPSKITPPVTAGVDKPEPRPEPLPATPGRGGKQHKYLQQFIKQWAEGMGWRATVEAPVPQGTGSVDILLAKDGVSIACEITVTTSLEHEMRNLSKCLSGGFTHVVSVCADERRAREMDNAARETLSPEGLARVRFLTVEGLCAFVSEEDAKRASKETTVRGYKVKVNYKPLGSGESAERMGAVARVVAKSLRRLKEDA